ncbi:MAG: DMT family transporter [Proteobacteria bacterium]|nr:DMT family transporter [Pseudomonadota bacterium]
MPGAGKLDVRGLVMVTAAAASWGTWSLFLRPTGLSPLASAPIVFLLMGLFALPFALRAPRATWDHATRRWFAAYVVIDALNLVLFFAAIATTTVQIAILSHYLAPIIIALAAPRIDGVRVPGARIAALVALTGLVIVLEPWHAPAHGAVLGALFGAASAVCYAGNVFTLRRVALKIGPSRALAYHALLAGLLLAPLAIGSLHQLTPGGLGLLAIGSSTIGSLSGILFAIGLTRIGSARAAILTFIEPVVAVLVGVIAYGEAIHPFAAVGGTLILAAGIHVARKTS